MILKTKEFQEACKNIVIAVENNKTNLELTVRGNNLFLNVTNKEYYVSVKFALDAPEPIKAVVDAQLFLNLISGITAETFELRVDDNTLLVKSGKSNYKLAMIYENDSLMQLPVIGIENKTAEMTISKNILNSIATANSKEIAKLKKISDVNELQKLYYIDENGCFTFTTGACLNAFSLEKPIKLLLNDRIVKLFKLFKDDVHFSLGQDAVAGRLQSKVIFENDTVYLAAVITNDDILLNKVQAPCIRAKELIEEKYPIKAVLAVSTLSAALSRLMLFTKNSFEKIDSGLINMDVIISLDDITFKDKNNNTEVLQFENESYIEGGYTMPINIVDLKSVLETCKENEHITLNCGNYKSVVIRHGNITNLIPESIRK